jgi:DNA-binding transcriptional LysR family regulator
MMGLELRHMRYFVTVAEELHFSRAAERLNITPPTLTHQIKVLETILGARLFKRKGNTSVALTPIGKNFLEEAKATLKQAAQAERMVRGVARGEAGSITIGYTLAASCSGAVASSIMEFKKLHPDVSFDLRKMETFPQLKALADGALDVGFMRTPRNYPVELTGFIIDEQPPCLAIPESHRLAKHKTIELDMLDGEVFVAAQVELEVGSWGNISMIASPKMSFRIATRYPDAFSVLNGVAAGLGLAVLSESLSRISVPGVVFRSIKNADRTFGHNVVFRKNEHTPVIKAFVDMLRKKNKK